MPRNRRISISVGSVVIAPMDDPQGGNRKPRTALVIEIDVDDCLLLSITSSFDVNRKSDVQVDLPWKLGEPKACTGLDRPSRLDVSWSEYVHLSECFWIGYLPSVLMLRAKIMYVDYLNSLNRKGT